MGFEVRKRYVLLGVVVMLVVGGSYFFRNGKVLETEERVSLTSSLKKEAVAFEELTVPYLRERSYESSLGELERIGQTDSYDSFVTSYDSDGLRINGLLTIPRGREPEEGWPAVVFVHGYIPPGQYKTTEKYEEYVDYLAENGLVVFKIDLRGHGDSEGEAEGAYYSSGYVVDVLNAYAALQKADFVNGERISLWGHSMAGNVLLRALVVRKDIKKVVIWAGAVYTYEDLARYRLSDNSYRPPDADSEGRKRRNELLEAHGEFDAESEFWKMVVPTNYLDGIEAEIQMHHAEDDSVVNIGYSRDLALILDAKGIGYEFYEYEGGGHNITGSAFRTAMERTVDFLIR